MPETSDYMTLYEVAREAGVNVRTLYRWHYRGDGPPALRSFPPQIFNRLEVWKWMETSTVLKAYLENGRAR